MKHIDQQKHKAKQKEKRKKKKTNHHVTHGNKEKEVGTLKVEENVKHH